MSLNIYNYERDYIGKIIGYYNDRFYTAGLYRCNGWIACVQWFITDGAEEPNATMLHWFFNDKEHAKRMLGLTKEYKTNALDSIREWSMKPCKEAADLAPLLFKAYKDNPFFVFYVDNDQCQDNYFDDVKREKKWGCSQ